MPLTGNPSHDIPVLKAEGRKQDQAVAIALDVQRRKQTPKGQGPGTRHKRQPRPKK